MKNNTMVMLLIVIIVAAAAFFGGMKYQESKATTTAAGQFGQGRRLGGGGGGMRPTVGTILSASASSITVKLQDGSSKIVLLTDKTQINKAEKATKDDLKAGTEVSVFGTTNTDGSVTAQNISLNPQFMGGRNRDLTPTPTP